MNIEEVIALTETTFTNMVRAEKSAVKLAREISGKFSENDKVLKVETDEFKEFEIKMRVLLKSSDTEVVELKLEFGTNSVRMIQDNTHGDYIRIFAFTKEDVLRFIRRVESGF